MTATFRGGLLAETPQTNGVTRLMAKALLKGTKSRTAEQLSREIESVGGSISSDAGNNSFSISVDVTKPDFKLGATILSDVLLNAIMPEKAVAREKEVQVAGIKQEEEQLTTVARNILREALFQDHPYSLRSSGSVESVQRLTPKELLEFRDRYLVAKNGVISVFGDVSAAEVKQLFEQALGAMKPGALALTDVPPSTPLTKMAEVDSRKEKAQAVLMVGYRGADVFSPDRYALELIDEASSDLGSRFFVRIREQMGLAYYVGASQIQGLVPGVFAFYVGTDPQKLEPVKAALLEEIKKVAEEGLTNEELLRAKKKLIGQQQIANQSNASFGYQCALDELYGLGFNFHKSLEKDVEKVTMEDIKRVATTYFRDQPYVLATVQPPAKPTTTKEK
jgi:zinc protease